MAQTSIPIAAIQERMEKMRRFLALPLLSAEATKPVLPDVVFASSPPTRVTFLDVPLSVIVLLLVEKEW